jgi:transcriptional regulator with XRE-family HTH domain
MPIRPLSEVEKQVKARFIEAMYMCIGKRICKTKKEFAEAVGILPTNISRLESNESMSISAHSLAMICKLGISPEWLLLGNGELFK